MGVAALLTLLTQTVLDPGQTLVGTDSQVNMRTHSRVVTAHEKIVIKGGSLCETTTVDRDTLITKE